MFNIGNRFFITFIAFALAISPSVLFAQDSDAVSDLDNFIHYSLIANVEYAEGNAMKLIRNKMSDEDFYKMVTETRERHERFDRAIGWAMYVTDLEPLAAELETRFEMGRTSLIRNAARLKESISLLNGTVRQRILAEERLEEAGEYAVPLLLESLQNSSDAQTARRVRDMLTQIGRDAVVPLSVALPHLDNNSKLVVIKTLGDIRYPHSAPAIVSVFQDENEPPAVKKAASQALARIGVDETINLSDLLTVVANQYFDGIDSVIISPVGDLNLHWYWHPQNNLDMLDVPQEIYGDVMAMTHASNALSINPKNEIAMGLFVAANLRRDRKLAGKNDLVHGDLPYSPAFYATVFGPHVAQMVLDRALALEDTALALEAITALSETAGAESLLSGEKPMIRAMYYPDRRVQYESALTLASTLPKKPFTGSYRVVPLLASAVRSGGDLFAIVIGDDAEARREMAAFLNTNGWSVVGQGSSAAEAVDLAGVVPGIDLAVVLSRSSIQGTAIADELASLPKTTVTPTYVLTSGSDAQILANAIGNRDMIETSDSAVSDSAKLGVIEDLISKASGGRLSYEEQLSFSNRSLEVLRDIALADTVLEVDDATGMLISALTTSDTDAQIVIAQTLAMIDDPLAQRALIDEALKEGDLDQRVMLLDEAAGSVRRWGNNAEKWRVDLVVDLAKNANGYLADAAARLNGALDNPNTSILTFMHN
jgi:hypothetical protein